jgi:hypothetical protein
MIAVIFEVYPTKEGKTEYLAIAARLREFLKDRPGFISIERFQSLGDDNNKCFRIPDRARNDGRNPVIVAGRYHEQFCRVKNDQYLLPE